MLIFLFVHMMKLPSREEATHSISIYMPYSRTGASRRVSLFVYPSLNALHCTVMLLQF